MADAIQPAERERNRAVRIAYAHARRGDRATSRRWLDLAAAFARPTEKQVLHAEKLADLAAPYVHPGQLVLPARLDVDGSHE